MDTKAINPTTAPIAPAVSVQPVQRTQVFSDESSLQSCGSVSSCFNWIYSFLASIWHSLFGSAELPKKDLVFEELKNSPESLVDRLVKSADHGQAEYIQLYDKYAKINRTLLPSAEFDNFSNLYWEKTEPFHPIMQENQEFFIRLVFGAPAKTEEFPDAPTDLLVSIAQDNALELIFICPEKRAEIISLLKPTQEQRTKIQKETTELLSTLRYNSSDDDIDEVVWALFRYQAVGQGNALPKLRDLIPILIIPKVAYRMLSIDQVGNSSKAERREVDLRLEFFTLLSPELNRCAKNLQNQPMPFTLDEMENFIAEETGHPGVLYYDYLDNDIYSTFAQVYNTANPNESEITGQDVKKEITAVIIDEFVLRQYYPDTSFAVFTLDYDANESIGCEKDAIPKEDTNVYLVEIKNKNQLHAPSRYAYYVFENNEDLNGYNSD